MPVNKTTQEMIEGDIAEGLENMGITFAPTTRDILLRVEHKIGKVLELLEKKNEVTLSGDFRVIIPTQEGLDRMIRRVKHVE